jgi:hypothetical protein
MRGALGDVNWYPDATYRLRERIAALFGVSMTEVFRQRLEQATDLLVRTFRPG